MLVAYLRGQLPPGYPNGSRSILRETVLLNYLDLELRHKFERDMTLLQSPSVGLMEDPNNALSALIKKMQDTHEKIGGWKDVSRKHSSDRVSALKLFVEWVKSGIFGRSTADELGIKL
jgi:hypothetical protein